MSDVVDVLAEELAAFVDVVCPVVVGFVLFDHGVGVGVCCSGDVDGEGASVVVVEYEFKGEADRFVRGERQFHFDLFLGDSQIAT